MLDLSTKMRKSVPLIWYFSFKAIEFASRMCYERLNNGAYHTSWMFSFCTGISYNVEELREQILVENLHDSTLFLSVQVSNSQFKRYFVFFPRIQSEFETNGTYQLTLLQNEGRYYNETSRHMAIYHRNSL